MQQQLRKMKRPNFSFLKTAPGNVKAGLHVSADVHAGYRTGHHRCNNRLEYKNNLNYSLLVPDYLVPLQPLIII